VDGNDGITGVPKKTVFFLLKDVSPCDARRQCARIGKMHCTKNSRHSRQPLTTRPRDHPFHPFHPDSRRTKWTYLSGPSQGKNSFGLKPTGTEWAIGRPVPRAPGQKPFQALSFRVSSGRPGKFHSGSGGGNLRPQREPKERCGLGSRVQPPSGSKLPGPVKNQLFSKPGFKAGIPFSTTPGARARGPFRGCAPRGRSFPGA